MEEKKKKTLCSVYTHCESLEPSPGSGRRWHWASAPGRPWAVDPAAGNENTDRKNVNTGCNSYQFNQHWAGFNGQ